MHKGPGIMVLVTRNHIGSTIFVNQLVNHGINIQAIVESHTILAKDNNLGNYIKRISSMGAALSAQWLLVSLYTIVRITTSILLSYCGVRQKILTVGQICKRHKISIIKTKDINSEETISQIKSFQPDIIVCAYFNQILKKEICDIPKLNCVNIHLALSQKYRGLNSYFWVLANNETESGVTIHEVDEGIDTGNVIAQQRVKISDADTAIGFFIKLSQIGGQLFISSLGDIEKGISSVKDTSGSQYYSTLTKEGYAELMKTGRKFFIPGDINALF